MHFELEVCFPLWTETTSVFVGRPLQVSTFFEGGGVEFYILEVS